VTGGTTARYFLIIREQAVAHSGIPIILLLPIVSAKAAVIDDRNIRCRKDRVPNDIRLVSPGLRRRPER
jgi:hypothetical protein